MFKRFLPAAFAIVLAAASMSFPARAQETSVEALQRQVQALLFQIQALQTQVTELRAELGVSRAAASPPPEAASPAPEFARPLAVGMSGDDVRRLQEFLARDPAVYPERLLTGYFGPLTEQAVRRWQRTQGIEQAGRVGRTTLARLNEMFAAAAPAYATSTVALFATSTSPSAAASSPVSATSTPVSAEPSLSSSSLLSLSASSTSSSSTASPSSATVSSTPPVCTPELMRLLGAGCIWKENTWFDYYQVSYLPTPTSTAAKSCVLEYATGCTVRPVTSTAATTASAATAASTGTTAACTSSQYWNGSACVSLASSSSSSTPSSSSSSSSTASSTTPVTLSITITSPWEKMYWLRGNTYTIRWSSTASGIAASSTYVTVDMRPVGSGNTSYLATVQNTGSWSWTVPYTQPLGSYILRAVMAGSGAVASDEANSEIVITAPISTAPDPASLIGHWKFDGSGANEKAGPAAVTVGGASFTSSGGKFGGYAYISSASDYVRIPYAAAFDLPNSFSVEFWFRQRSNQSSNQSLVYKGNPPNNYNFNIFRYLWNEYNSGAVITGYTAASTGYWTQTSNDNIPAHNEWHHVVFAKSQTSRAYYIDGIEVNSASDSPVAKTPHSDIILGSPAIDTDIDNLKIYNQALTPGEVWGVYSAPTAYAPSVQAQLADIAAGFARLIEQLRRTLER